MALSGEPHGISQSRYSYRAVTLRCGPVTDLTLLIVAPAPDRAVSLERTDVSMTGRNLGHLIKAERCCRCPPRGCGSVANLTMKVRPHAVRYAVAHDARDLAAQTERSSTDLAGGVAAVALLVVAVVAGLLPVANVPVAAASQRAAVGAVVCVASVAVVARLKAVITFAQIVARDAVAASSGRAGVPASVGVHGVAVVAEFIALHHAITAGCGHAASAVVGRVIVAVIAALVRTHDPIAAASE